ncbi:MAG TPA: hypothetical protein VHB49_08480 [Bradyrhizobium sp.]|nr:hypothetical protein [Bradyrhizobium sp.]
MKEVELTIGRLLRIFWLLAWRGTLGGLVLGAVVGFIIGFIMGAAGSTREHVALVTSIAGLFVGAAWTIVVVKMALEKQYDDFRIALIGR